MGLENEFDVVVIGAGDSDSTPSEILTLINSNRDLGDIFGKILS